MHPSTCPSIYYHGISGEGGGGGGVREWDCSEGGGGGEEGR